MSKITDEWQTPQWLFDELNAEFHFNVDICATQQNKKCDLFYDNVFDPSYFFISRTRYFMNPPYSNVKPFIQKAWELAFEHKSTVVMLLKCDTSTSWWGIFWDYEKHKPRDNVEIRFIPRRLQFVREDKKLDNANFPSCIVILKGE